MSYFVEYRNQVFTRAVMEDDWDGVMEYASKYGVPLPKKHTVMKAGIYKAVQDCTGIPEDVKKLAAEKCRALGFNPHFPALGFDPDFSV